MPIYLRLGCFAICAACLPISFSSHKNWALFWRWVASLGVVALMGYVSWVVVQSAARVVTLVWNNPSSITVDYPLTNVQLNAKAFSDGKQIEGDFIYEPTFSTTLPIGTQTLRVTFIPKDNRLSPQEKTVAITVTEPPVDISPSQIVFHKVTIKGGAGKIPGTFQQQYSFRVTNTTARDVYSIGAELKIDSVRLGVGDFSLDIPKSSLRPLNESDPANSQTGDTMVIGIHNKQTNLSYFIVEIMHLGPHESREIPIWQLETKNGGDDPVTVTGRIYHFSLVPEALLRNAKGGMFLPGAPLPESGNIEKVIMRNVPRQGKN
jgi:hypothetical protein